MNHTEMGFCFVMGPQNCAAFETVERIKPSVDPFFCRAENLLKLLRVAVTIQQHPNATDTGSVRFNNRCQGAGMIGIVVSQDNRLYRQGRVAFVKPINQGTAHRPNVDDDQFARGEPNDRAVSLANIPEIDLEQRIDHALVSMVTLSTESALLS